MIIWMKEKSFKIGELIKCEHYETEKKYVVNDDEQISITATYLTNEYDWLKKLKGKLEEMIRFLKENHEIIKRNQNDYVELGIYIGTNMVTNDKLVITVEKRDEDYELIVKEVYIRGAIFSDEQNEFWNTNRYKFVN